MSTELYLVRHIVDGRMPSARDSVQRRDAELALQERKQARRSRRQRQH